MPPLKAIEQGQFGGVDSRSNPVVMPQSRFLRCSNWMPRPDGHLELREGYTKQPQGTGMTGTMGPIHSMSPYTVAYHGPLIAGTLGNPNGLPLLNGAQCIFFWIGKVPYLRWLDGANCPTHTPVIRGHAIASSARWQYALGKDGYLYMHNGTDAKFFDGVYLRDIGLPILTSAQASGVSVNIDMAAPTAAEADGANFDFAATTHPPPTTANAISGLMYVGFFDKSEDVCLPCTEPLHGDVFPNGHTSSLGYNDSFLRVNDVPLPAKAGAVSLLYYPGAATVPTLTPGSICKLYPHDVGTFTYNSQFEYANAADTYGGGQPLPGTPSDTFTLPSGYGLMFNPMEPLGHVRNFMPWDTTMPIDGRIYPMVVADVNSAGGWAGHTTVISPLATPGAKGWVMTVEGSLSIPVAGDYSFIFLHDDGALIGFGDSAVPVSGYVDPAFQTMTADKGYTAACSRQSAALSSDTFTVNFPTAGLYHFEIDYCNWQSAQTCCLFNGDGTAIIPGLATPSHVQPTPSFLTTSAGKDGATLSYSSGSPGKVNVHLAAHGFSDKSVIVLALHKSTYYSGGADYTTLFSPVLWSSNGPFTITKVDDDNFTFNSSEASLYGGATPITVMQLVEVAATPYVIDTDNTGWPFHAPNGIDTNQSGQLLLPGPLDPGGSSNKALAASSIGGTQPGYQFFAAIYDPLTGHVGNRVPIGQRLAPQSDCTVQLDGLPDLSQPFAGEPIINWGNGSELQGVIAFKPMAKQKQGLILGYANSPGDSEWCLLIGRTGDGGEVPYATIDALGNWIYANPAQSSLTLNSGLIDGNSELPVDNYMPPKFFCFWREGDRMCGSLLNQPFVYRSGSEVDATTGIFVGVPAQAWNPARLETFPTAAPIWGGFGYMQESWVFSMGDLAQLSELSGEVAWNGPYNPFGIIGQHAFDKGWNSLPFWVSKNKELCTMLPNSNGPMVISTEYEAALLAKIGDDVYNYATETLVTPRASNTELVYFYDPLRKIECLRIKCVDAFGLPFTIIHDFMLRDDLSPYGQGYEANYTNTLGSDFTTCRILDASRHQRMWAGGDDGYFYAFYSGGTDNGDEIEANAITLRYIGGDRTAVKTIEWYGDEEIKWYILDRMVVDAATANDRTQWTDVTDQMRPFPGDEDGAHYQADIQRPEMIHCYLWIYLNGHHADAPNSADPMALSSPVPHAPLETYGRLYLAAPILGVTRGR